MADAMAKPLAIVLEVEFLDRLAEPVREGKAKSISEIIRTALERCDLSHIVVLRPAQLTISVRLPSEVRRGLKKMARAKHTSVGQLVRAAVEAYLPRLESETAGQLEMSIPSSEAPPPAPESSAPSRTRRQNFPRSVAAKKKLPAKTAKPHDRAAPRVGGTAPKKKAMTRKSSKG
jgi:predicted DNA-binding protein